MTLSLRLRRLEQRTSTDNPLAQLNDEELEQAIAVLDRAIQDATGLEVSVFAEQLSAAGSSLPDGIDADLAARFVRSLKTRRPAPRLGCP